NWHSPTNVPMTGTGHGRRFEQLCPITFQRLQPRPYQSDKRLRLTRGRLLFARATAGTDARSLTMNSIPSLKSPTVLFVVGALAVGAVGSKMLWTDSPAIKVPVATVKPKTASATHVVGAAAQARQTPRELAASKRNPVTGA